ncbi:MAG: ECF transporter S component [Clostridia bacterium]|nr:ECF transporter S component [Clostridia bacterium]
MTKNVSRSKWLALTAILAAMSSVLYFLEMPVPLMPAFIQFDFSMLPIFIGNIALGPLSGIVITAVKDLIHLIIKGAGATGGIGDLADFFTCLCFILPSGLIYKKLPNFKGMIIGLITGCIASALLSGLIFNALVVYPLYDKFILPMTAIIGMYKQIRPSSNGLWEVLAIFNVPYTFLKCVIISILAVIISKPLESFLKINKT